MDGNKDISGAIIAEQSYIQLGDPNISLLDELLPFGYEDLNSYFYDKVKYQIVQENLMVRDCHMELGVDEVYECLTFGKSGAFTVKEYEPRTWVWCSNDYSYLNAEKANELGIGIRTFDYNGGPIITTNDDFSLALVLPNRIDLDITIIFNDLIRFLSSKGYNLLIDGNDLMLGDEKVLGSVVCKNEIATLFAFELSLVSHKELIDQISLKKSEKIAGHLEGLTRDEVEEEVNRWLHTI